MEKNAKWGTSSSNTINVIKSRMMRWVVHVTYIGKKNANKMCEPRKKTVREELFG
jgi:Holliday junction resolvasome RuvABC DNA-binding subunit